MMAEAKSCSTAMDKGASVTFKNNCCVKLGPQALGIEFRSAQMLIFFLLSQPRFWISSQIMQSLREMLHGSVTFARAGLRSSSATKVLEVTKPVLLLFTSLALVAGVKLQTGTKLIPSNTA